MHSANPPLAKPIVVACVWNGLVEFVGLWFSSFVGIDYRLAGISLPIGWLPIVAVALRRPQAPTSADIVAMFAGYPMLYLAMVVFSRLYP